MSVRPPQTKSISVCYFSLQHLQKEKTKIGTAPKVGAGTSALNLDRLHVRLFAVLVVHSGVQAGGPRLGVCKALRELVRLREERLRNLVWACKTEILDRLF